MTPREQAISDMKYAKSLGETALFQHFDLWSRKDWPFNPQPGDDEYFQALQEIMRKRDTNECLLVD